MGEGEAREWPHCWSPDGGQAFQGPLGSKAGVPENKAIGTVVREHHQSRFFD
jgi:hypothetical protein